MGTATAKVVVEVGFNDLNAPDTEKWRGSSEWGWLSEDSLTWRFIAIFESLARDRQDRLSAEEVELLQQEFQDGSDELWEWFVFVWGAHRLLFVEGRIDDIKACLDARDHKRVDGLYRRGVVARTGPPEDADFDRHADLLWGYCRYATALRQFLNGGSGNAIDLLWEAGTTLPVSAQPDRSLDKK